MRQPFDDTTKTFYSQFFKKQGLRAIPEYQLFTRSRAIDLVVECKPEQQHRLQNSRFDHFQQVNAIEFKGLNDPLNPVDFNRIMMRAWALGGVDPPKKEEPPQPTIGYSISQIAEMTARRTVTIVCVTKPDNVLQTLKPVYHFESTAEAGVYRSETFGLPVWIIHPSELAFEAKNYALLPLARGDILKQFIELCLADGLVDYLQLTLDIGLLTDPDLIWRKIMEAMNMNLTIREDTRPYIDEFFRAMPEEMQKLPTFREVLEDVERKSREQGLAHGLKQGHQEGLAHGLEQGHQEGLAHGLEQGHQEGLAYGLEQGQVKGRVTALRETIARTLHLRFQADQAAWLSRLAELPLATLETLSEAAILADSLADFESRLAECEPNVSSN